uniref:STT3 oligosaccharyltransferase complex catalytic subunit B n=1 Tax=Lates calcarifer TaxID=8187 RepID=A0A4W6DTV3_LATCA
MAEHHAASDGKHKASTNAGGSVHGNSRPSAAGGGGSKGGLSGGLTQPAGWQSLLSFSILFLACLAGFSSRLFAVIRFESIIHEFDPWPLWCFKRAFSLSSPLYRSRWMFG